jgi:hypothetical protein
MPLISGGFRGHSSVQVDPDKSARCLDCGDSAPSLEKMPRADESGGKICLPTSTSRRGPGFSTTGAARKSRVT